MMSKELDVGNVYRDFTFKRASAERDRLSGIVVGQLAAGIMLLLLALGLIAVSIIVLITGPSKSPTCASGVAPDPVFTDITTFAFFVNDEETTRDTCRPASHYLITIMAIVAGLFALLKGIINLWQRSKGNKLLEHLDNGDETAYAKHYDEEIVNGMAMASGWIIVSAVGLIFVAWVSGLAIGEFIENGTDYYNNDALTSNENAYFTHVCSDTDAAPDAQSCRVGIELAERAARQSVGLGWSITFFVVSVLASIAYVVEIWYNCGAAEYFGESIGKKYASAKALGQRGADVINRANPYRPPRNAVASANDAQATALDAIQREIDELRANGAGNSAIATQKELQLRQLSSTNTNMVGRFDGKVE